MTAWNAPYLVLLATRDLAGDRPQPVRPVSSPRRQSRALGVDARHDVGVPNAGGEQLSGDFAVESAENLTSDLSRMTEEDFWDHLEYRVTAEFAGFGHPEVRRLWCDGFLPEAYVLGEADPTIRGQAWIGLGRVKGSMGERQERWEFVLHLEPQATDRASINWSSLLPPSDVTGWLATDPVAKRIDIDPAAAVPDQ